MRVIFVSARGRQRQMGEVDRTRAISDCAMIILSLRNDEQVTEISEGVYKLQLTKSRLLLILKPGDHFQLKSSVDKMLVIWKYTYDYVWDGAKLSSKSKREDLHIGGML